MAPPTTPSSTSRPSSPSSDSFDEGRFPPGTVLADRYRIIALLGRGGMGEVYRSTDLKLGQAVALKFLPEATASDPDALQRFFNEVRIARQVSHPNVCRVYDIGEIQGQPYISMEYIDGEDLGSLLRRIGRLPNDKAIQMARQLCAGLHAAHDKGVLHRDLKPANVMIDGRGQVLIMDFGLAGLADHIQGAEIRHGTPAYMAPEQLAGKEVTVRSDIYALGLVLYEMFAGKRAYDAPTLAEMISLREESKLQSIALVVKDLDPAIEGIVARCLHPDPARRPPTALAVSAALPGGDPLAAALAAGETPSPELVAAAAHKEGFAPMVALACLIAIMTGLAALPFLNQRTTWITNTPFENSPDALKQKARDIERALGYSARPADSAFGLRYNSTYLDDLKKRGASLVTLSHLELDRPSPILFWRRTSPREILATQVFSRGAVDQETPPMDTSGMTMIELDTLGRLVSFEAVPPQVDKSPPAGPPNWDALLLAAGLDPAQLQPATPEWTTLESSDERAAWIGSYPNGPPGSLRVEAAGWRGKPVYFTTIYPWTRPTRMEESVRTAAQTATQVASLILLGSVLIGAGLLARHNIRAGRGDRKGAIRIAGFLFVLDFASWLCGAHNVASTGELILLAMAIADCLFFCSIVWLLYIALEPYVRRRWPGTMISWTRALAGQVRDPLVGAHVLAGILMGVLICVGITSLGLFQPRSAFVPSPTLSLDTFVGVGQIASLLLYALPNSILGSLGIFFLYFLLRLVFRKEWLTGCAFVAILLLIGNSQVNTTPASIPLRVALYGLLVFVMLRYGLVSFVVGQCVAAVLIGFPITADFSAWYAGSMWLAMLAVLAVAGYAFHTALAGRPVFKEGLLEN